MNAIPSRLLPNMTPKQAENWNWSQQKGFRPRPKTLEDLKNPYFSKQYSLDERVEQAQGFDIDRKKEDYISSITGKPKSSSTEFTGDAVNKSMPFGIQNSGRSKTSAAAPSSISDSYRKMGAGGMMGKLEGASLRLGQAESDRRIREQELEEERESKRRIGAGFKF